MFAILDSNTGLLSVPAGGGEPRVLTKLDPAQGERDHLFSSVLPCGRVLFTIVSNGPIDNAQVAVRDLKTGQRKTLIRGGSNAEYVDPSTGSEQAGYLVYAAAGSLRAVRFDLTRLQVLGDPVPVVEQVSTAATGAANFSVSRQGTLVYVPAGAGAAVWPRVDHSCGSTVRGWRSRSRRRLAAMSTRDSRPMARGWRSTSAIRRATSGSGISRARR